MNIAESSISQDRSDGQRMLKFVLSDGQTNLVAVEHSPCKELSLNVPPGSKLRLLGKVQVSARS